MECVYWIDKLRTSYSDFYQLFEILQFQEIKSNKTVLHLAVKEGNVDLVGYLLTLPVANMKDYVNLKVSITLALKTGFQKYSWLTQFVFPSYYRLTATQLYTWLLVFTVTPTRRRSCSCCWEEGLIRASATWRTTSRLTCCRAATRENRWVAWPSAFRCVVFLIKRIQHQPQTLVPLQLKLMLKKRSTSTRRRIVSSQDQD